MDIGCMVQQLLLQGAGDALFHAVQAFLQLMEVVVANRHGLQTQARIFRMQTSDFGLQPRYFGVLGPHFRLNQMLGSLQRPYALRLLRARKQRCSRRYIAFKPAIDPWTLLLRLVLDKRSLLLGRHGVLATTLACS